MGDHVTSPEEPRWRPRVRLPHRLGPISPTGAEMAGVAALIAAAFFLALAAVFSFDWNLFLVFPAFGIPDLLFAWFRRRRFRLPARWSTDLRATILLTVLTAYLAVSALRKVHRPVPLTGVSIAVVLGGAAATIWTFQVIRDRPR
jgi:amino acid transporter